MKVDGMTDYMAPELPDQGEVREIERTIERMNRGRIKGPDLRDASGPVFCLRCGVVRLQLEVLKIRGIQACRSCQTLFLAVDPKEAVHKALLWPDTSILGWGRDGGPVPDPDRIIPVARVPANLSPPEVRQDDLFAVGPVVFEPVDLGPRGCVPEFLALPCLLLAVTLGPLLLAIGFVVVKVVTR